MYLKGVTTVVGVACYPLDTIRRRIMMQVQTQQGEFLYKNAWHCIQVIFKQEGFRGFFVGYSANLIRGVGGALLLVGYDEVKPIFKTIMLSLTNTNDIR